MEFALPKTLQSKLVAYDPTLKKIARETRTTTTKRSKYPLGNVNDLIPTDVVPAADLQRAVDLINSIGVSARYSTFGRQDKEGKFKLSAILYHYESAWLAAWFQPNDPDHYYHVAFAFKNTAKASDINRSLGLHHDWAKDIEITYKNYGKSEFHVGKISISKESVRNGKNQYAFYNLGRRVQQWSNKGSDIYNNSIKVFEKTLTDQLPSWSDSNNPWERVSKTTNNYKYVLSGRTLNEGEEDWIPNFDLVLKYFIENRYYGTTVEEKDYLNSLLTAVLSTPFFKRWIQDHCKEIINKFHDPEVTSKAQITVSWHRIAHIFEWFISIIRVWPGTPVDYLQSNLELLIQTNTDYAFCGSGMQKEGIEWLRKNMPVESFFHILKKHHAKFSERLEELLSSNEAQAKRLFWNGKRGSYVTHMQNELSDTISMINNILSSGKELEAPKRWRIEEFHDHVQGEAWKIRNPNVAMPQDLFPTPVKVKHDNQFWTFFQPIDSHQLSSWGQAVRNCVGSASTYYEGVKKKQHFIVLCMLDGKPRFTIQLKVNNGVMHVSQIADIGNRSLSMEEKDSYTAAFSAALKQMENALTDQT